MSIYRTNRFRVAIKHLADAVRETEAALEEMCTDSDPLAVHIFTARRQYRNVPDTKGGKRSDMAAKRTWTKPTGFGLVNATKAVQAVRH